MEGFLVSLPVFGTLVWWLVNSREFTLRRKLLTGLTPMLMIGIAGLASMGLYNQAVTGNATKMPYQLHDGIYSASSLLIWKQPPEPEAYNHPRMERFYLEFGRERQLAMRLPEVYWNNLKSKFYLLWRFVPLGMGISFFAIASLWKDRWARMGLLTIGALLCVESLLASSWMYPHYLAPAMALFYALSVQGLRNLRLWNRPQGWGKFVVRVVLVYAILRVVPILIHYQRPQPAHARSVVEKQLLSDDQKDLVIVSYADDYPITRDWVYNAADIDASPIVWARDMGTEKNARLLEYFAGRKIWRWHVGLDDKTILAECSDGETLLDVANKRKSNLK